MLQKTRWALALALALTAMSDATAIAWKIASVCASY
jgi:hypothetical protein